MFTDSAASVSPAFEDVLPEEPRTTAKRREICQSFQHGKCRLGAACPERHVLSQFKTMRLEVCKHWLRGACVNGENCLYLHAYDDRYVPSCAFYQRLGECTNPECPFQHVAQAQQQQQPECAAYRRGFCPRGPQCHLRHVWREACVYYLAGFCPLGARCPAGHPVQELYNRNAVAERLRQRMLIERADDPTFNKNATCYRCFDPGHLAPKCPGVQNGILRRLLLAVQEPGEQLYFQSDGRSTRKCCFFCGEEGHEVRDCPKKSKSHQGNAWHKNRRGDMAGRQCVLCYRRVLRRHSHGTTETVLKQQESAITATLTNTEREAAALACILLDRHRQQQRQRKEEEKPKQEQDRLAVETVGLLNRKPAVDALTGYGKTFVMANLAHETDACAMGTQELIHATDKKWDTLTVQRKISAALGVVSNKEMARTVVRNARSTASVRFPKKKSQSNITPFDTLLRRYAGVVPEKHSKTNRTSSVPHTPSSWCVSAHATMMQGKGTLRGVLARRERCERRDEWCRVWNSQLPDDETRAYIDVKADEGSVGGKLFPHTSNNNNNSSNSSSNVNRNNNKNKNTPNLCLAPDFRRHFLGFGSYSQEPSAFLTDPAMYYVLSHLRLTGEESLLEVRRKAESLTHRYNEYAKIS